MPAGESATLRLDKWLWFARLTKSRSLAARLCEAGAVAIAGRATPKPHHPVRIGDIVTVPQGRLIYTVRIVALGSRRGPASEARTLYAETLPPRRQPGQHDWTSLLGEGDESGLQNDHASPHREEPPQGGVSNGETRPVAAPQDEGGR